MTFRVGRLGRSVARLGRWVGLWVDWVGRPSRVGWWDWAWAQAGSVGPIEWVGLGPKGPVQVIEAQGGQT